MKAHEVGRDGNIWRELIEDGFLFIEAGDPRVGVEAFPVKLLCWVDKGERVVAQRLCM